MKIICADDNPMHLSLVQSVLKSAMGADKIEIWKTGKNGEEAVECFKEAQKQNIKIDLVTLDIRMPVLDGLSALVKLRSLSPTLKIVMASSEDENTMKRYSSGQIAEMPVPKKIELLEKVKSRIVSGVQEAGKINSILNGCEELLFDPIEAAKHFKANGYMHKPYTVDNVKLVLDQVTKGGPFISKVSA